MEKEKSAGAVIFMPHKEGNKYLLLHYEAGHWDFPKGNIEEGEEEEETVRREVEEETGIKKIDILKGFKEKIHYFYRLKGELRSKDVVFYLAKTETSKVKISFEHIGYGWLSFDKALEKLTYKNSKEILEKANEFLGKNKRLGEFLDA